MSTPVRRLAWPVAIAVVGGLALIVMSTAVPGCGKDNPLCPTGSVECLRYNEVMFKQTHNSYIETADDKFGPNDPGWRSYFPDNCLDMVHGSIESQLTVDPSRPWAGGAMGIELDIWWRGNIENDKGDLVGFEWDVKHVGDFDARNWPRLSDYLRRLRDWSRANPGHQVVTVKIEDKRFGDIGFERNNPDIEIYPLRDDFCRDRSINASIAALCDLFPSWITYAVWYEHTYKNAFPTFLDDYIRKHFDVGLLYTPKQLKKSAATLEAGAKAGWPTMKELKGKFIFFVMGSAAADSYAGDHPEDRLCFQRGELNDPNCVFTKAQDGPLMDGLLENGGFFAQYLKEDRKSHPEKIFTAYLGKHNTIDTPVFDVPCPDENAVDWAGAFAAGVNIIQTDIVNQKYAMIGTRGYWPIAPGEVWKKHTIDTDAPDIGYSPAAAIYEGRVYVVWDYKYQPKYWRASTVPALWGSSGSVGGGESAGRPALAVHGDKLWMFSHNRERTMLYYRTFDGNVWTTRSEVAPVYVGPGAAEYKGTLYVFYPTPPPAYEIVYKKWNGSSWTSATRAIGRTESEPAVCVHNGKLKLVYRSMASNEIRMAYFDGKTWSEEVNVASLNGAYTSDAPSAAVINDRMEVAYRRPSSNYLYTFSVLGDSEISSQGYVCGHLGPAKIARAPGSVSHWREQDYVVFHKDDDSNRLRYVMKGRTTAMSP